jgi:uncharacterized membrane protein
MPILLILLPSLFQMIFGRKAVGEDIKLGFGAICLISFLSQIAVSFIAFFIMAKRLQNDHFVCGLPLLGIVMCSLFFTLCLFIIMIIQYFIKRSYERK